MRQPTQCVLEPLHPKSISLRDWPGMVFNIEPAIYIEGYGSIRHCDMFAVTESGAELLTPFQTALDELLIPIESPKERMIPFGTSLVAPAPNATSMN